MFDMFRSRSVADVSSTMTQTPAKPARLNGSIRALKQGYGFIAGDDGEDYFFHWSAMDKDSTDFRELVLRQRVEFHIEMSSRGPRAVEIVVLSRRQDA